MIACAKNNVGIIQVAKEVVLDELANGALIEILKKHSFSRSVYIYYKKIKFVEPKIRRFMDFFFANS